MLTEKAGFICQCVKSLIIRRYSRQLFSDLDTLLEGLSSSFCHGHFADVFLGRAIYVFAV